MGVLMEDIPALISQLESSAVFLNHSKRYLEESEAYEQIHRLREKLNQ